MASSGIGCTGPVGPEGSGGSSCLAALGLAGLRRDVCAAWAVGRSTAHRTPRLSPKVQAILLYFDPVPINSPLAAVTVGMRQSTSNKILAPQSTSEAGPTQRSCSQNGFTLPACGISRYGPPGPAWQVDCSQPFRATQIS